MRLILYLLALAFSLSATQYYVSNTGSDAANGTSTSTPWQTIAHVNAQTFSPGDSVLFQSGGVWHEQLVIPSSGNSTSSITFGAYGTGSLPIISAADSLSGWTNTSGNVWQASLGTVPNIVDFAGSLGVPVTSQASVIAANEWYFAGSVIYVYDTVTPDSTVLVGLRQSGIDTNGKNYITISGLDVIGANGYPGVSYSYLAGGDVFVNNSSYVTVSGCTLEMSANFGMKIQGSNNITVSGNTIQNIAGDKGFTRGDGIDIWGVSDISNINAPSGSAPSTNVTITGNTFQGYFDRQGIAVEYGQNVTISNNTMNYAGPWSAIDIEPGGYPTTWSASNISIYGNNITLSVPTYANVANPLPFSGIGIATSATGTSTGNIFTYSNTVNVNNLSSSDGITVNCSTSTCPTYSNSVTNLGTAGFGMLADCYNCTLSNNTVTATSGHTAFQVQPGNKVSNINATLQSNTVSGSFNSTGIGVAGSNTVATIVGNRLSNGTLGNAVPTNGTFGMTVNATSASSSVSILGNSIVAWQYGVQVSSGASTPVTIANNTILGAYYGIRVPTGVTDSISVDNNLIEWLGTATTTVYYIYAASTVLNGNNNLFYYPNDANAKWYWGGAIANIATWRTNSGMDANGKAGIDPLLVNYAGGDYSLSETSPARNAGIAISGYPFPYGAPDLGALPYYAKAANTLAF